jgi:hypothetical protein
VSATLVASRYRLGAQLGRSALGTTHLGSDLRSGAACVIKRFALQPGEGARLAAMVETERPRLLALSHPNLARVLECEVAGDELCMVQQLVEGRNLDQQAALGPRMRARQAAGVGLAVARALQHIHAAGLVHGAVRPSNILRSPFGKVFLVDLWGPLAARATVPSARGWAAPEGGASPAADVYALGASLVFLLSHCDPATLLVDGRVAYRSQVRVPANLAVILDSLVDPDPDRRPLARDLITALGAIAGPEEPTRPPWMALAIGGAALLLLTGGVASRRRNHGPSVGALAAPVLVPVPRVGVGVASQVGVAPAGIGVAGVDPGVEGARAPAGGGARGGATSTVTSRIEPRTRVKAPAIGEAANLPALQAALGAAAAAEPTSLTIPASGVWASVAATDAWKVALSSPALAGVEELRIEARLTRGAVAELATANNLRSLRALVLVRTGVGDDGVLTLSESRLGRQLEELELSEEELTAAAARALARSPRLLRVRELRLGHNHLGEDGAVELARSHTLRALERLDLAGNELPEGTARLMVLSLEAGGLPGLAQLQLTDNALGGADVAALSRSRRSFAFVVRAGEPLTASGSSSDAGP